jgi:hypothetical protein
MKCCTLFGAVLMLGTSWTWAEENPRSEGDNATLKSILAKYREYEERANTIAFRLEDTTTIAKGRALLDENLNVVKELEEDFADHGTRTLLFSGVKMRESRSHTGWTGSALARMRMTDVFDGTREYSMSLYPSKQLGWITARQKNDNHQNMNVKPIFHRLRPLEPTASPFKFQQWTILPDREKVDDRECLVVEEGKTKDDPHYRKYWLDVERDWAIVREHLYFNERLSAELDVSFRHDATHGWLPSEWQRTTHFSPRETTKVEVKDYRIGGEIDEAHFKLDFPVGTRVYDHTLKVQYFVPPRD